MDGSSSGRGAIMAVVLVGMCGCSSSSEDAEGATGGVTGSGGAFASSGGAPTAGGGIAASGGTVTGTGGVLAGSGGIAASGGAGPSTGGASTGGAVNAGGSAAGGETAAGGESGSGGVASGGSGNTGGAPPIGEWTSQAIENPPSYMGSTSGVSGCTTVSPTRGFEPVDEAGGEHPLFLYFVGTTFSPADTSARYDSLAAETVTESMARRGFVALSVHYDNTLNLSFDKVTCLYASSNPESVLAVACALPQVNCDLGIATWGHSQGALMAHVASLFEPRVRAVWTTGYSGGDYPLSNDRLRVVNGEADAMNGGWDTIKNAAGYSAGECPNNGGSECLRPDGSGFIIVRSQDCVTSSADHCWFDRRSCGDSAITLEPNWTDRASTKLFALESNADWVAETVARP